jgi:hypothetical protein
MDYSYLEWQKASFTELTLLQQARREGIYKAIGGVLLVALAITTGISGFSSVVLDSMAIAGGVGGTILIAKGYKSKKEAQLHQDAINELGESINLEMETQVISFEDETVELTGNIQQQFMQWREFLKRIYEQEATPNVEL